jgi:RNA polymerase sigma-70 factor (ECF subfamily)
MFVGFLLRPMWIQSWFERKQPGSPRVTNHSDDASDIESNVNATGAADDAYRQPESAACLQQLRSDGEQVLAAAFAAHRDRFWHLVNFRMDRRIAARVDADDVLQEAFVAAVGRLDHYLKDPSFSLFVWLRLIVSQTLVDLHRRHLGAEMRSAGREVSVGRQSYPQTTSVSLASQLVANQTSPSGAAQRDESQAKLTHAIEQMSPLDQETIALRHFEGLSNSETAEVLGISVTAASNRYVRALARLKQVLDELDLSE